MNYFYNFTGILKNNLKINFKDNHSIFLHLNYRDNYFYINSKNNYWLKEIKVYLKFEENFNLKINIKFFQNYCKIKINNFNEIKYYYQVDPSYFQKITYSDGLLMEKIPNNNNIITYSDYLKNKRVVIVAPGGYLKGLKKGDEIDSYDIVVRINTALPIPKEDIEDIGNKTDILYNCLNKGAHNGGIIDFNNFNIEWISCPYPKIYPFRKDIENFHIENKSKFKFHLIEKEFYIDIETKMGTRPNTGIGAILDLLQFPLKELYLTGFTFLLKSGYLNSYKDFIDTQDKLNKYMETNIHDRLKQVSYIKPILLKDIRVKMEQILIDILNEN